MEERPNAKQLVVVDSGRLHRTQGFQKVALFNEDSTPFTGGSSGPLPFIRCEMDEDTVDALTETDAAGPTGLGLERGFLSHDDEGIFEIATVESFGKVISVLKRTVIYIRCHLGFVVETGPGFEQDGSVQILCIVPPSSPVDNVLFVGRMYGIDGSVIVEVPAGTFVAAILFNPAVSDGGTYSLSLTGGSEITGPFIEARALWVDPT